MIPQLSRAKKKVGPLISKFQKFALVSAVVMFVLIIFSNVLYQDRGETNYEKYYNLNREALLKEYEEVKHTEGNAKEIVESKMLAMCYIVGDFCNTDAPTLRSNEAYDKSIAGKISGFITFPYINMPASGLQTTAHAMAQAGLIPAAYAAEGIGQAGLSPYASVWKHIRNISYLILVLVMIFAGFAIMFRQQIDAQKSITIENMLPKLIITMILIQLSFTIAGFAIDLMYIFSAAILSLLSPFLVSANSSVELAQEFLYSGFWRGIYNMFDLFSGPSSSPGIIQNLQNIFWDIPNQILNSFGTVTRTIVRLALGVFGWGFLTNVFHEDTIKLVLAAVEIGATITTAGTGVGIVAGLTALLATIFATKLVVITILVILPQVVIGIILFFSLLYAGASIIWMMLKSYVQIILLVVFAPFFILLDLMPGKEGFKPWIKGLLYELSVFPIFLGIVLTGYIIITSQIHGTGLQLPLVPRLEPTAFSFILGIVLLFMAPTLINKYRTNLFGGGINLAEDGLSTLWSGLPILEKTGLGKRVKDYTKNQAGIDLDKINQKDATEIIKKLDEILKKS